MCGLSIIIPVLNDAPALDSLLRELAPAAESQAIEILVVDGGSTDAPETVIPAGVRLLHSDSPGRGRQLALGAREAQGQWLWLLHADTRTTTAALSFLEKLNTPGWGRFDVQLFADSPGIESQLRRVAFFMNWRSRLTGICTGDQGIFVHRSLLDSIGGIPEQPLMEDIELCRRLKRLCQPLCPAVVIGASGRRWQRAGVTRTVLSMWWFRLRYWFGVDSTALARDYYRG